MEEKKTPEAPVLNAHNKEEHRPSHTCEHIVNQTMIRLFGCGRSVSAHIERKKSKLDYRLDHRPTDEEVKRLEEAVNEVIARHLPVTTEYITQEEARGRCSGQPRAHVMLGIPGSIPWGFPRDKKGYLYHNRRRRGRYDQGSRSKLQF